MYAKIMFSHIVQYFQTISYFAKLFFFVVVRNNWYIMQLTLSSTIYVQKFSFDFIQIWISHYFFFDQIWIIVILDKRQVYNIGMPQKNNTIQFVHKLWSVNSNVWPIHYSEQKKVKNRVNAKIYIYFSLVLKNIWKNRLWQIIHFDKTCVPINTYHLIKTKNTSDGKCFF